MGRHTCRFPAAGPCAGEAGSLPSPDLASALGSPEFVSEKGQLLTFGIHLLLKVCCYKSLQEENGGD